LLGFINFRLCFAVFLRILTRTNVKVTIVNRPLAITTREQCFSSIFIIGRSTLTFGSPKHQPSLAELLSSPTAIAGNSTQMGHNKLNPLKGESKSSSSALPSLSELMKQGQHGTSQQHSKSNSNSSLPSLSSLLNQTSSTKKQSSTLPSLTDILKNGQDESTLATKKDENSTNIPDLSSLLRTVNINNEPSINISPLIKSVEGVNLSDLATMHKRTTNTVRSKSPELNNSPQYVLKESTYMNRPSSFGKIVGAQYRNLSSLNSQKQSVYGKKQKLLKQTTVNMCILYTEDMISGKDLLAKFCNFTEPSPDDVIKNIQDKAFERDSIK